MILDVNRQSQHHQIDVVDKPYSEYRNQADAEYHSYLLASRHAVERSGKLQIRHDAETYKQQNREDLAAEELAQVAVIEQYLPKPLSEEEIEAAVKAIVEQTGASSMKDMGKVMGMASKQLAGRADGKVISTIVKKLLA